MVEDEVKIDGLPEITFSFVIGAVLSYFVVAHYKRTGKVF